MSKPKQDRKKDRHVNAPLALRLPEKYKALLRTAAEQSRRKMTEEAKIALENHFKSLGIWTDDAPAK